MVLYILTISKTSRNSSTGMDDSHVGSFWLAEDSFIWLKQIKFRLATIIEYRLKICRSSQSSFDILKPFSLYKKKNAYFFAPRSYRSDFFIPVLRDRRYSVGVDKCNDCEFPFYASRSPPRCNFFLRRSRFFSARDKKKKIKKRKKKMK